VLVIEFCDEKMFALQRECSSNSRSTMSDKSTLTRFADWYLRHCDGDWEHFAARQLETLACQSAAFSGMIPSMEAEIDCKLQSNSR
jgi:hypothetical protein